MTNKKDIRKAIVKNTSEMLDNPDKVGIYPTTKFYENLEAELLTLQEKYAQERVREAEKATALKIVMDLSDPQWEYEGISGEKCGNVNAIKWGIMKGWGVEPADTKLNNHKEGE